MTPYEKNILAFPHQLSPKGLTLSHLERFPRARPDGVVIVGIGGSALAGEILRATADELKLAVPVLVWKNYGLPRHPYKRPLYLFVSFSGDTEEPLSGLPLLSKTAIHAAVATGGKLAVYATRKRIPFARFPAGVLTPRQSSGILYYAVTELLHAAGLIRRPRAFTSLNARASEARGKRLARALHHRLPIIYTDESHRAIGYIWKIRLNETAKTHAFSNILPEIDHNELTAYDTPPRGLRLPVTALFLFDTRTPARLAKKLHMTEELIRAHGARVLAIPFTGKTHLEKIWRSLMLADWTSFHLGKLSGIPAREFAIVNPRIVLDLKRRMR